MILLFLGDWRSTLIIAVSIPLSIMVSVITLGALGETINIMTLGGLALAVGILVDDATVAIENIDRNLAMGKDVRQAILDGSQQIAVPALVSTLCICIVFVPMFFLTGVARYPVRAAGRSGRLRDAGVLRALAHARADAGDVPAEAGAQARGAARASPTGLFHRYQAAFERRFERFRGAYERALAAVLDHPKAFGGAFLAVLRRVGGARRRSSAATSSRRSTPARFGCTCARAPACASKRPRGWPIRSTA